MLEFGDLRLEFWDLGREFWDLGPEFRREFFPGGNSVSVTFSRCFSQVFGMVPFLSSILATLVPLLGTARTDSMKCTLSLQRFGESIQEYVAGRAEAPDPTVRSDAFGLELGAAFDILSHGWMQGRDGKVRLAALEALGPLSSLIPGEQLEEQLPKLLPTVLGLYRKHPEPFPISKSLCQLLEASVALGSRSLEAQLEPLLAALLAQVGNSSAPFPARLLAWLLPRLESGSERHRHGALRLLRHLLNSAPSQMEMQKVSILSALKVPLQDPSNKVKCALVQLISALAHHGFLEQPGAEALLEFLVEQCALPAEPVLWPFLLPLLLRPRLRPALVPLCRSLAGLAQRHREFGTETQHSKVPSLFRGDPGARDSRLEFPSGIPVWNSCLEFPAFPTPRCPSQFLRESLSSIPDKSWIYPLVSETFRQLRDADGFPAEKNFLYRSMGTALGLCPGKELVRKQLQELLENARYLEETEREGLASCFGICARNHLEETLEKLEEFEKSDVCRKSQGLFSIFKDRSDSEPEQPRAALVLCLGRVAAAAPPELLRSRLEPRILGCLLQLGRSKRLFRNVPSPFPLFPFSQEFLRAEPPEAPRTRLRQHALSACAHLVYPREFREFREFRGRDSGSDPWEFWELGFGVGSLGINSSIFPAESQDFSCQNPRISLQNSRIFPRSQHLGPWIRSPREPERERGLGIGKSLLEFFLENLDVRAVTPFPALPALLALLAPRCSDGIPEIRSRSLDCVRALLRIQLCFQGFLPSAPDPSGIPDFLDFPQILGRRIPPEQLPGLLLALLEAWTDPERNCGRAAAAIGNALIRERGEILHEQVPELLQALHARLALQAEPQLQQAAQRAVQLLALRLPRRTVGCLLARGLPLDSPGCCLWRALGSEPALTPLVLEQLLERLSREIPFQESPAGRVATALPLAATRALAELAAAPEAAAALQERFPELFQVLLLRLGGSVGIRPPKSLRGRDRNELQSHPNPNPDPDPEFSSCAVQTMKAVLARAGNDDVVRDVGSAGGWELMEIPERHHDGIALLAGAMARLCGPRLPPIVRSLIPVLGSALECQRVTSSAFLAELLSHKVVNDLVLLEPILEALTALEKDSCLLVRVLALRGLGNVASGSPEKIRRHGAQLLASMLQGMDDKDDPNNLLALEAMSSLSKILDHLEERDVQSMLLHIAIRIRPFFDSEHAALRHSSIILFGNLSRFGRSDSEVFSEQILNGLVTLLLHLQDPQPDVVKACKFALRMCGPGLGCEELREMFGNHLREERGLHYGEFLNNACKFLMRSRPALLGRLISTNLFYFKSPWRELRAAAAMSVGFLVLHVDEEQGQQVDLDQLISALQLLLKDPAPDVRIKAAETLGRLVRIL
uniref:Maestro heat like repeat family member 1 n=1 Tax=Taeniopygia guttata TaxID=59729 RepID=A0A674GK64_TAEGU